jgi:phage FluMu protein Com
LEVNILNQSKEEKKCPTCKGLEKIYWEDREKKQIQCPMCKGLVIK